MPKVCLCRKCGDQFNPAGRFVDACPKCGAKKWSYSIERVTVDHGITIQDLAHTFVVGTIQ